MTIFKVEKYPTVGNLVKTEYLIGPKTFSGLNRRMPCNSVILAEPFPISEYGTTSVDGLLISDRELVVANTRYIRKCTKETGFPASQPLGKIRKVDITSDNKNKKPVKTWFIVLTASDNIPCGYMFSPSELNEILARTARIPDTVVKLSLFQRFVLWVKKMFAK